MAAHVTGTCSVCTRENLRVLNNGTIGRHNIYAPNTSVASHCPGVGQPSLEQRRADREASASKRHGGLT